MPQDPSIRDERRHQIEKLLRAREVRSQGELAELLTGAGYAVTQASVSRDLRALGAIKREGAYRLPEPPGRREGDSPLEDILAALVRETRPAGPNLLVLKTPIGGAGRVGVALDGLRWPEVIGTVSGDDTVFVAVGSRAHQARLLARLRELGKELVHV